MMEIKPKCEPQSVDEPINYEITNALKVIERAKAIRWWTYPYFAIKGYRLVAIDNGGNFFVERGNRD
jgi:hypothetical protein